MDELPNRENLQLYLDTLHREAGVTRAHLMMALLQQADEDSCIRCLVEIYFDGAHAKCKKCWDRYYVEYPHERPVWKSLGDMAQEMNAAAEKEGVLSEHMPVNDVPCYWCDTTEGITVRTWTSNFDGHVEKQYRCKTCNRNWWEEVDESV